MWGQIGDPQLKEGPNRLQSGAFFKGSSPISSPGRDLNGPKRCRRARRVIRRRRRPRLALLEGLLATSGGANRPRLGVIRWLIASFMTRRCRRFLEGLLIVPLGVSGAD